MCFNSAVHFNDSTLLVHGITFNVDFLLFQLPSLGTFNEQVGQFCKAFDLLCVENSNIRSDSNRLLMTQCPSSNTS
jgi:hypothetical protein